MTGTPTSSKAHTRLRILLACLLLGVYLLVYVNAPDSADGNALLAVSAGFLRHGSPDMNAVAHSEAFLPLPQSRMGSIGVDGALYSKKGVTPSLFLLPLVAAADALPWLTTRATAMFFNPLVTTVTALALYTLVVWLGFRARTAFVVGLIFGLCTFAMVYTQTLFGEPLAGLLMLLALMAVYRHRQHGNAGALAWAGLLLGLLVGVNTVYAVVLMVFGVYVFAYAASHRTFAPLFAFAIPACVVLAGFALFNWVRFGSPLDTGYRFSEGEGFTHPFLLGLYGQLLSPYRGLFWYNPALLLALPGAWMLRRQHGFLAWALVGLALLQAVLFASWWSWHGGVTWGARFLVPAVPLLALCLAPVVERSWSSRLWYVLLSAFVVVSFGVQLLGVSISYAPYMNYLNATVWHNDFTDLATGNVGSILYSVEFSPIIGHLAFALNGWQGQPAWLANGVDGVHLAVALSLIALGLVIALIKLPDRVRVIFCLLGMIVTLNVVGARQAIKTDAQQIQTIQEAIQPADTLYAMTAEFGTRLLDLEGSTRVFTVNAPTEPRDSFWDAALQDGQRFWLLTWFPPADPLNWQERQLWETAAFVMQRPLEGHRAIYFHRSPDPSDQQVAGWRFGEIAMESFAIQPVSDGVRLTVRWSANPIPDQAYSWFIHLLNPNGEIAAQQDRQPQGGYAPTHTWLPGEPVVDRMLFPVQVSDLDGWKLRVGFIHPATGEPLPVIAPDGTTVEDGYVEIGL